MLLDNKIIRLNRNPGLEAAERSRTVSQILKIQTDSNLEVWSKDDYLEEMERTDSIFMICAVGNVVVGFSVARIIGEPDKTPDTEESANFETVGIRNGISSIESNLLNFAVTPTLRSQGIGRLIMAEFLEITKRENINSVWLEVRESNSTAISFYRRNGFRTVSIRKNLYSQPIENGLLMCLSVELEN